MGNKARSQAPNKSTKTLLDSFMYLRPQKTIEKLYFSHNFSPFGGRSEDKAQAQAQDKPNTDFAGLSVHLRLKKSTEKVYFSKKKSNSSGESEGKARIQEPSKSTQTWSDSCTHLVIQKYVEILELPYNFPTSLGSRKTKPEPKSQANPHRLGRTLVHI